MAKAVMIMVWDDVDVDRWGDEYQLWYVARGDEEGDPIEPFVKFWNRNSAINHAEDVSKRTGLQVEIF